MQEDMELLIMNLIVDAGSCRSAAMNAINCAKEGQFDDAAAALKFADESLLSAHHVQTDLIQAEVRGEKTEMSLLMVHAQDHIMTAMLARDLAAEFVALYKKLGAEGLA